MFWCAILPICLLSNCENYKYLLYMRFLVSFLLHHVYWWLPCQESDGSFTYKPQSSEAWWSETCVQSATKLTYITVVAPSSVSVQTYKQINYFVDRHTIIKMINVLPPTELFHPASAICSVEDNNILSMSQRQCVKCTHKVTHLNLFRPHGCC